MIHIYEGSRAGSSLYGYEVCKLMIVLVDVEGSQAKAVQGIIGMTFRSFLTPDMASKSYDQMLCNPKSGIKKLPNFTSGITCTTSACKSSVICLQLCNFISQLQFEVDESCFQIQPQ